MASLGKQPIAHHGAIMTYSTSPPTTSRASFKSQPYDLHLIVCYGPAGTGKTSITKYVEEAFNFTCIEGDEVRNTCQSYAHPANRRQYHTAENIAKMIANVPLQDADRWDWLIRLREAGVSALESGATGVVVACSALKKKYRDVIRIATLRNPRIRVHFLCLEADRATLMDRVCKRKDHYMGQTMVDSQLRDLEPIGKDESDVIAIDVRGTERESEKLVYAAVSKLIALP